MPRDEAAAGSLAAGRDAIIHAIKEAPSRPGVYRMIDGRGDVLYVGKAKNIKKRIGAYARPTGLDTRIERMIAQTRTLEFVVTRTETEALLLEANLIKRLRPRFNVTLRDDKSFPYILITSDHWAPQILKHRGARSRPGQYYGPFASVWAVNRTVNALQRAFLLRSCSDPFFESRTRPCLLYQIKRCSAPCTKADRIQRLCGAGARSQRVPVRPQQDGQGPARRGNGKSLHGARLRARRDLPRPPRGAVGDPIAAGHQSAHRRGGRRLCRAPAGRLHLRRSVLLPHRAELGQPRLFSQSRQIARAGRSAFGLPGAVLRRQAAAAPDPDLARHRGPGAACRSARHQERPQGRNLAAAARREEGFDRARARQCARGARPQTCGNLVAAETARINSPKLSGCRGRRAASRFTTTATSRAPTRSAP